MLKNPQVNLEESRQSLCTSGIIIPICPHMHTANPEP